MGGVLIVYGTYAQSTFCQEIFVGNNGASKTTQFRFEKLAFQYVQLAAADGINNSTPYTGELDQESENAVIFPQLIVDTDVPQYISHSVISFAPKIWI